MAKKLRHEWTEHQYKVQHFHRISRFASHTISFLRHTTLNFRKDSNPGPINRDFQAIKTWTILNLERFFVPVECTELGSRTDDDDDTTTLSAINSSSMPPHPSPQPRPSHRIRVQKTAIWHDEIALLHAKDPRGGIWRGSQPWGYTPCRDDWMDATRFSKPRPHACVAEDHRTKASSLISNIEDIEMGSEA
ncbi:hypothetical protein K504DRAFT_500674 [Pleomassaria siparia CBS 279.74]|uniref:Uncharacterized protein n=1 Tax=Pleomassaria siparia CBS 279.74 TaxID=1314801 RepID=A0A6G1KE65_9PLEO|nr:hypothetical protein K504DRAFT_500674 [Pleomassaria siparia CBS 279.74]